MSRDLLALGVAGLAAGGAYLIFVGVTSEPKAPRAKPGISATAWLGRIGLGDSRPRDVLAVSGLVGAGVALAVFTVFGAIVPAAFAGLFAATFPVAGARHRRVQERSLAADAWPRLLEELRLRTTSLGRSIPQALFEVGRSAPGNMRTGFATAHREWLMSTDFARTLAVLKRELADPTADIVCETLLVAHHIGGADLDRRLAALIEDRTTDTQARKDARAKQAGARFARRFVLAVPFGMALAGMSVGNGRVAFQTPTGQALTILAIAMVVGCWLWSGAILRIPEQERVFPR